MIKRPRALTILMLSFFIVAVSLPLQVMLTYNHMPWETLAIAAKIAPLNWLVIAACILHFPLLHRASKALYVSIPAICALVHWNNVVVAEYALQVTEFSAHMATLGFISISTLFLLPQVQHAVQEPSLRWWLIPKRHLLNKEAKVEFENRKNIRSQTHDISLSGAFVHCEGAAKLKEDQEITLTLNVIGNRNLTMRGKIKRIAKAAKGKYPQGFAVQFVNPNIFERSQLAYALWAS